MIMSLFDTYTMHCFSCLTSLFFNKFDELSIPKELTFILTDRIYKKVNYEV